MRSGFVEAAEAQLKTWYPQFAPAVPPLGTAAVRAYRGRIQPFASESDIVGIVAHLRGAEKVRVEVGGELAHPLWCEGRHQRPVELADLGKVKISFEVLLLDFEWPRHCRVFGVAPEISRRTFPQHPHFRDDQMSIVDDKPLPALCTYLSSDNALKRDETELVQILDFTSIYLAKHAFWAATQRFDLFDFRRGPRTIYRDAAALNLARAGETHDGVASEYAGMYRNDVIHLRPADQAAQWIADGYRYVRWGAWLGPSAPHFVDQMVKQFGPEDDCPCGSGLPYADCHREEHEAIVRGEVRP
jgi:hypothetical protein